MRVAFALLVLIAEASPLDGAEPPKPSDIARLVEAGRICGPDVHLGMGCSFTVDSLNFIIVGVGEIDSSVGFLHSDMNDKFYGSTYAGCVGVRTGMAYESKNPPQQIYVSTKNGNVYLTRKECQAAK